MYWGPLELMQYLDDTNPDFVQYHTINTEVITTRIKIISVYDENGGKTYIDDSEVFVCLSKSTALNIALHQNQHKIVNPENGPVIEFLDCQAGAG